MINYIFNSKNNRGTKKIAEFMKGFNPKINFKLEEGHFGLEINCQFVDENERDLFIKTLNESLDISEDGSYIC